MRIKLIDRGKTIGHFPQDAKTCWPFGKGVLLIEGLLHPGEPNLPVPETILQFSDIGVVTSNDRCRVYWVW